MFLNEAKKPPREVTLLEMLRHVTVARRVRHAISARLVGFHSKSATVVCSLRDQAGFLICCPSFPHLKRASSYQRASSNNF
ncbi:hypothetical protein AALO_G00144520 [Alosa alosa]|uniref:Uncharacterized protein n=1 Tax=Alosa alosa TaxID=278164 RepID=A0AAV6GK41_9TELE|nr:hypothetical protein AALO_G00144520 [Alosa alosa]